ncbi:DUF7556 family protein [Natrinema altunense]|uniref:Uncharacterized protein n=1 Tax=Natrinema altunense (strain JCM 12890 / CGMCC 1.3731 / AJ2) TaxID=1227494 RepID=L9ZPA8_NATA2|nr:hypothetical protein [Natrinema altunense]ELY86983.1 hypothetical protein C485_08702 [Natrinema altunense JCM 12890]
MVPEADSIGSRSSDTADVVAAVDEIDGTPHLVVADIARDERWIAMTETDVAALDEWR